MGKWLSKGYEVIGLHKEQMFAVAVCHESKGAGR